MKVRELIAALEKVENKELDMLWVDTRSGVVEEFDCYGSVSNFDEDDSGYGVDWDLGTPYVAIYNR